MGFIPDNQNDTNNATSSTNNGGSSTLRSLNDCKIMAPLSGQGLLYNGNLWQNYNLNLSLLSDVDIQELAGGEVLTYDAITSKWKNQAPTSGNLSTWSDIAITEPISDSSSLIYNTFLNKWINTPNQVITMDLSLYVRQLDFIGGGTGMNPSYYSFNSTYYSIVVDGSFVTQASSYFVKLPTNLSNGSIIYIQVPTIGTAIRHYWRAFTTG